MEVRSGGQPGRTDPAYDLTHVHPCVLMNIGTDLRKVPVDAGHAVLMLDANRVAQFSGPAGLFHLAVGHCSHRSTVFRDQIDSHMWPIGVQEWMIAMEGKARGDVLKIEREAQRLRTERASLLIVEVGGAMLIAKRVGTQSARAEKHLSRLSVPDQLITAGAADLLLVDNFPSRPGLQLRHATAVGEGIEQRVHDWRGNSVTRCRTLEVFFDLETHLHGPDVIFDWKRGCLDHHIAEVGNRDAGLQINIILKPAQLTGLRILVERQRMIAREDTGRCNALEN